MKKSLWMAAATAVCCAAPPVQAAVTIYGITDVGVVAEGGGATGSVVKMTGGVDTASRIGFRGVEDLGGGLSATFVLESGVLMDTGAGQTGLGTFGRLSTVGLKGGFGAVTLGHQYTPYFKALKASDPFELGLAGRVTNLMQNSGVRYANSIAYVTPVVAGFSANVAYGLGEVAGNSSASRNYGFSANYRSGPLSARIAFHNGNNPTATDTLRDTLAGAGYNFGIAKVDVAYAVTKGFGTVDSSDILLGVSVPFGASRLVASYVGKNDKTSANQDADQLGIGYVYSLSKHTEFYTAFAHINNKNGAAYKVGNNTEAGSGNRAFDVGMRHTF